MFFSKVPELFNDPADPYKYRRNLLKVEVYYDEFEYETIEEKPTYEVRAKATTICYST